MSIEIDEEIECQTARRKSALVFGIIQGKGYRKRVLPTVRFSAFGDIGRGLTNPS